MYRIDVPSATPENLFTDGSPTGGVPATTVPADWLNDVQEELISILTAAGVTPVKGVRDQVVNAIVAARLASVSEAQGFSINTKMLSPGRLADALKGANQSLLGNGYQKFPGGLIVQWGAGVANASAGAPTTVTLPVAFSAGHLSTVVTRTSSATSADLNSFAVDTVALNSFVIRANAGGSPTFRWVAIGW